MTHSVPKRRFSDLPLHGSYGYLPLKMNGPLGDPRVRQALAMVIDREALAAATGAGTASPIYGVVSWGLTELPKPATAARSEEPTSELQSLMRSSYAFFCLKTKKTTTHTKIKLIRSKQ